MTLDERIERLESIEEIRSLQSKYQRSLDTRDFDTLASCFIENAISSYGDNKYSYIGKDEILKFLINSMDIKMPSIHLIHGSEIEIIDDTHAKAKWYLEDHLLHERFLVKLYGAAIYNVEYIKDTNDNKWYISNIGYNRQFEYIELRGLVNLFSLHKKTFLKNKLYEDYDSLGYYNKLYYDKWIKRKRKNKKENK